MLSSCLGDDEEQTYAEWRKRNDEYMTKAEARLTENGEKEYTRISADWAPGDYVLVKWHNDRAATARNLSPLSNSTVDIKYEMENIEGDSLGNSYSSSYGDSIYRSRPNQNIIGMWAAMLNMHVGDSVTMVIPYHSAYGDTQRGEIIPYSNLIYRVKMKAVTKFEKP